MSVFRNAVFLAAVAGFFAGAIMTGLQTLLTVPLILEAETYETAGHNSRADHSHEPVAGPGHQHDKENWAPAYGVERNFYTALANIVTAIGFALLLVAASELAGGIASWRQGIVWGLAAFASFTLAPGLGLPPELPAMPAADLISRQVWWTSTVAATAGGLALIAFGRSSLHPLLGLVLILAPHIVGAPMPASHETPVPHELHRRFVVAVTATNLIFWSLLGYAIGFFRARLTGSINASPRSLA